MAKWNFVLDTNNAGEPKLAEGDAVRRGLRQAVTRPFRVAPFFDPAPWGGQWMKQACDLDRSVKNYGWCFDCVPEENSLLLGLGGVRLEIPAMDLVFDQSHALLGRAVVARFGDEFPIRFDFLDTMGGGYLSFQVHPLAGYVRKHFGLRYTQDESYYLLDAGPDAGVYLGLRENTDRAAMTRDLEAARTGGALFPAEKYANRFPAKKHDHFLIPAGTVHCSGANAMVLEISATPYIFTFKLWDWGRPGLDGKPRPTHLEHGLANIQWERDAAWTKSNLVNRVDPLGHGDGWREERTGLHELEFIETRRHWFTKPVPHDTGGGVNVLNLVAGDEAIVESPDDAFEPFVVHYAETFIVPAAVGRYHIRPHGESIGSDLATIKPFVRSEDKRPMTNRLTRLHASRRLCHGGHGHWRLFCSATTPLSSTAQIRCCKHISPWIRNAIPCSLAWPRHRPSSAAFPAPCRRVLSATGSAGGGFCFSAPRFTRCRGFSRPFRKHLRNLSPREF